jgi:hypothetical protein
MTYNIKNVSVVKRQISTVISFDLLDGSNNFISKLTASFPSSDINSDGDVQAKIKQVLATSQLLESVQVFTLGKANYTYDETTKALS